ncbi:MAG: 5'-methylthioadenosine/adenosylhomocysteine nucleosidase [Sulfurospirillum sp.]|nr:5'-methylthioadenosine/adenosylhomocysteine nucleosidase [Sulfurospirillum sp.]MBL0703848.1 5'-methylthioadenosine/adenosylhomocysteine nucleosidase [Sulfurospirillum sp.]
MKLAIMGAMPEEIEPFLKFFKDYKTFDYAKNKYFIVEHKNNEIIIAYSKIGKVNSTITASVMIEKFGCEKLIFSGVAGAVCNSFKIGDLVAATKLVQHDLDISSFGHPYGYVPEGAVYEEADLELIEIAKKVAIEKNINLKYGVIATGDQFICDIKRKNWIANTFNATALEMEGASVAVTCNAYGVPFFILRAISDEANMDAKFNFDEFLETSSQRSADFILSMVEKIANA